MTLTSDVDIPTRHLHITQRLRQRRDDLGLTQKQVVTRLGRCGIHTTNRALSSLEHGTGLDVAKLPELAAALDCTVTYLIGLTDDPHRWEPDGDLTVPARPTVRPAAGPPAANAQVSRPPDMRPATPLILGADVPERIFGRR